MAIIDDFKLRFPPPAFETEDVDTFLPPLIEVYSCYNGWNYDTKCGKEVILNLLAHLLVGAIDTSPTPSQIVGGVSVGDVSITNTTSTLTGQSNAFFGTTKYGRTYLQLISYSNGGVFV